MKRVYLTSFLLVTTLLAACGESDQNVSRTQSAPLDPISTADSQTGYFSSRSAVDLLSFD